jgi:hypothetical protein
VVYQMDAVMKFNRYEFIGWTVVLGVIVTLFII